MMTRKHFEKAALLCREAPASYRAKLIGGFVDLFRHDNPRFDATLFLAACEPVKVAPVKRARLDRKGTAKPLARIVAHVPEGAAIGPGITRADTFRDDASGASIPLG